MINDIDIFVTTTGNKDVVRIEHMREMKDMAIVGNIGHFDNEIQVAGAEEPQVDQHQAAGRHDRVPSTATSIILLSEGRLVNLGNATGHPSFVMSALHQPGAGPDRAVDQGDQYENQVYILPKHLDEKVAAAAP
jgi:adenosylhomocysteinase